MQGSSLGVIQKKSVPLVHILTSKSGDELEKVKTLKDPIEYSEFRLRWFFRERNHSTSKRRLNFSVIHIR